ncbi:FRAS1-related extracellular matrix protein 2-like [Lingula anatina]|uniref:FRAS1-related extracellular matrix protein 2-like n=1 Tax=Lingula anatina TaxID=7574 RepID=A0A1S3JTY4_LINAN|nr:FRAS1-related extracellular matrix protein 2-like [Lingula anatina]|eukprot:XP_013413797.1 FRAS1-related extracellular matrix protein 2-like [Lingula anatina]
MDPLESKSPGRGKFLWLAVVFVLACMFCMGHGQLTSAGRILRVNRGIQVPFGRSVYLDPERDLKIDQQPGDRCIVSVLETDVLAQRPGMLMPHAFPCRFRPGEVEYTHFGSRNPLFDRVRLQIRYDSQTETIIIPFTIEVEVLSVQLEIVTRNMPITVDRLLGYSTPINNKALQFTYDRGSESCKVSVLSAASGLPRYGEMANTSAAMTMIDCEAFLESGIRYKHTSPLDSPNRDYIPMVVELMSSEGTVKKQEYFQVMVRIKEGLENTPPSPSYDAILVLEVDQFVMTAITPDILAAIDQETPAGQLIFNITRPLTFDEGVIVSTDDRNLPVKSFYQSDVQDLKIAYKPPSIDSAVRRIFQVEFQVVDAEGLTSDPFTLMIIVKPMNTLAPVVTRNTGIQLFEGQSRPLLSAQNLEISDEDNLDDVRIQVIDGLRHGELHMNGIKRKFFSPADLDAGMVVYQHDGSDTYSDNIIFRMTDGEHEVEFLFPVTVYPEDDEPPIINVNTGLQIQKNDVVSISPFVLSATDIDSDDASIKFTLLEPHSTEGMVMMRQIEPPSDPDNWRFVNGHYERPVTMWTQQDIVEGKLFYHHVGPHNTEVVMDRLKFTVQDNHTPPNVSPIQDFVVKIMPVDDQPPYLCPRTPLLMTVNEFQLTHFRKKVMCYTDLDSIDRELQYTITAPPYDTDTNNPLPAGSIVLFEYPEIIISEFTQAQVNHRKVGYQPPSTELGITPRLIQFEFDVKDTAGNVLPQQKFTIKLQPVDNKPPVITNPGFSVFENNYLQITPQNLDAVDPDTDGNMINFTVVEIPVHGQLTYLGNPMAEGEVFKRGDISSGRIAYLNQGQVGEMDSDKFKLDVTDGIHHIPVVVKVAVRGVDDEMPSLALTDEASSGNLGFRIEVKEGQSAPITSNMIKATDTDTDDLMLTFLVESAPRKGVILLGNQVTDKFTQSDIINNNVVYMHTSGEIGPEETKDHFTLTLSDMSDDLLIGGNRIQGIKVNVTILPVDNNTPVVVVGGPLVVPEGNKSAITLSHISASDVDSEVDDIQCTIIVQPTQGYLENSAPGDGSEKSRAGMPISTFTMKDIRLMNINYVQSIHQGVESTEDRFTFRCSDGVNFSPNFFLDVVIIPDNDEVPELYMREFVVLEGNSLVIDTPILNAIDKDIPEQELIFHILEAPGHGKILQQRPTGSVQVDRFSVSDISDGSTIVYEHDDSETTEDKFKVKLTDGKHEVEKEILIMVIPVDDETPRLTINNGLEVDIGETKVINDQVLKAEDLDSDDLNIQFIVRKQPIHGYLQRVVNGVSSNITRGMNFSQWEIDDGSRIQYVHTGAEGVRDLIKFDVTDGFNPLIDRYFYVSVEGIDMTYPEVINKGVELPEGGSVILTTDLLSTYDLNSPDENLQFTITRAPSRGHLESTDQPGVPITTFTQLQLAGNKIRYVHMSEDEMKMDSFEFEVTDGYNPVVRTFRVSLSDIDNKKPVLMLEPLRVKEGGTKLITPFELKAVDRDTDDTKIRFTVTQIPIHGTIRYNNTRSVTTFTMEDLNENLITYAHDGTETLEDSFALVVTDGTHTDFFVFPDTTTTTRRPQEVLVEIIPVDNGVPQIAVNRGGASLDQLGDGRLGFRFTNKVLKAEDRDSTGDVLKYKIITPPEHGYIINRAHGNKSVGNWSQEDVDRMRIHYILKNNTNATGDVFYFKITDKGGNVLDNQPFYLNWAWISFATEYYIVNETDRRVNVTLNRRGFLGETSFITITAKNGTAKVGEDVRKKYAHQVQFNPGQMKKNWHIRLIDDDKYEDFETFTLELSEPVMGALEHPKVATVRILDKEDESTVFFPESQYTVEEDIGIIKVPIKRTGDISDELMVICSTVQDSATGTVPSTVTSYSDYITRPEDHNSMVRFDKNEDTKFCNIQIIDDSLFEEEERFQVVLTMPMGGKVGQHNMTEVVIAPDKDDEPAIYLGASEYEVDESDGFVEVKIWRTGTDLSKTSSVTIRSKKTKPVSADAGLDYSAINRVVNFAPGMTMQTVKVTILDDLGQPRLEGPESFQLVLRMPTGGMMGEPSKALVVINDSVTDLPKFHFEEDMYMGFENDGVVRTMIRRTGDTSHLATVRCYTRQDTARVMMDYSERPDTDASIVTFLPGEVKKPCVVELMGDSEFEEEEEQFRLVLGSPSSPSAGGALIGSPNFTTIVVKDAGDKPIIKFERTKYSVNEPMFSGEIATVEIPVVRLGDLSQTSIVRVHTKDGSAKSGPGNDYHGFSKELEFGLNVSRHVIKVEVLYDGEREMREAFTVHIKPDRNMVADVQMNKAIVYIEEMNKMADVTFPSPPMVVSLRNYDDAKNAPPNPVQGYPVICITPCNPKHPEYYKTGSLCTSEGINDTQTIFRWRVSAPSYLDGVTSELNDVSSNTFFTNTHKITLDSIYFSGGSRVQCAARAVNEDGDPGLELLSPVVTVSSDEGICMPRVMGSVGAEPFTAKLRYTGPGDPTHPNMVRLSVTIPHRDGMLPVISTNILSNFELALSPDAFRIGQHKCSNLLDYDEVRTKYGYITNETKNPNIVGSMEPYQYNADIRSEPSLRFYKNLDLEACLWEFVTYYTMSELVTDCGGTIGTDGQVLNLKQSYVSVRVPLYVSYVFHSPVATGGWQNYDLSSQLRLTFVYDTAILWQNGIGAEDGSSELQGFLYPTSMRIRKDGRLAVNFRTEARFRGQYVLSHPGTSLTSMVMSAVNPDLTFTLELLRSEPTFEQPEQTWEFVSDYAVRDYSGKYTIKLIPCTTPLDQEYALPVVCNPRQPMNFDLDIRFQQISDPVPAEFSLNTNFHLLRKKALWLSDGSMGFGEDSDAAFGQGDKIYGRIMVDSVQNLGDSFNLNIEKVFICTGKDGYIPKYDPANEEYGCVADSPNLQQTFRILDKGAPNTISPTFRDIPFNARLAVDDPSAVNLVLQPGSDGFSLDAKPLFKVDSGRQWFVHAIYTVRSMENSRNGIGKRSITYHSISGIQSSLETMVEEVLHTRRKRAIEDTKNIGQSNNRGTNMVRISLNFTAKAEDNNLQGNTEVGTSVLNTEPASTPIIPIIIAVVLFLVLCIIIIVIVIVVGRKKKEKKKSLSNGVTVPIGNGKSRVYDPKYQNNNDSSEV